MIWLKNNLVSTFSRAQRMALIERIEADLPLSEQAALLCLSRSSLYYVSRPPQALDSSVNFKEGKWGNR